MSKFDNTKCINNIYYLIKDRNMKIGDVENKVGVSAGYFSRLSKEDNQAIPSLETICNIADLLNVSIDALLYLDLNEMGAQDKLVSDFILRLIDQTTSGKLLWTRGDKNTVYVDIQNWDDHPLYEEVEYKDDDFIDYNDPLYKFKYNTVFRNAGDILGEFYEVYLEEEKAKLFIVKTAITNYSIIEDGITDISYELFIYVDKELNGICNTDSKLGKFYEKILPQLYNTAAVSSRKSKINGKVKNIITSFMKNTK